MKGSLQIIKDKRGSHVGMILSFVIFITFIVFLYTIVKPAVNTGENKATTLAYIKTEIMANVSANFTTTSLQISTGKNPATACIKFQNFLIFTGISTPNIIVKNETGGIEEGYFGVGEDFGRLAVNRKNGDNVFFKVYHSPELNAIGNTLPSPCDQIDEGNYGISSIRTETYVFNRSMYELIDYYKADYEKLKTQLNVPSQNEFSFSFTQSDGVTVDSGGTGKSNVYAEEIPIQYIDSDANILSGFINIRIW
jgi:hypothetical protein